MNANVHLKQVVTSDANVGRQLKFSMGELMIFAFLSIHSCTLMFFFFFHELDFSSIRERLLCCGEAFFPLKSDNTQCKSADAYKDFTALEGRIT